MSVEEACRAILGDALAEAIADDMGWHWAAVAAIADATIDDDPEAIETLVLDAKRHGRAR